MSDVTAATSTRVTRLLADWSLGDAAALERLLPIDEPPMSTAVQLVDVAPVRGVPLMVA